MRRELFDYHLPPEFVAVHPLDERDAARLLVLAQDASLVHAAVRDLDRFLPSDALLVVNDTRVIPARLVGHKAESGGRVEVLLVRRMGPGRVRWCGRELPAECWTALSRSAKSLRKGAHVIVGDALAIEIADRVVGEGGLLSVLLFSPAGVPIDSAIESAGHVPLPPYLHRPDGPSDRERYQTIFAKVSGAVAAPTAGLHLTPTLVERLRARGVAFARVTLHVGLGTFQSVTADDLDDHPMHAEVFVVSAEAADAVARAKARKAPVVAVGTTVVRALESAADPARKGHVRAMEGKTRLLIQPGYRFRVVDRLLTNFHVSQSTLLALVSAFAGRERILQAYQVALSAQYRFLSYGDAMLIQERA